MSGLCIAAGTGGPARCTRRDGGKKLTVADANRLIAAAERIKTAIGC